MKDKILEQICHRLELAFSRFGIQWNFEINPVGRRLTASVPAEQISLPHFEQTKEIFVSSCLKVGLTLLEETTCNDKIIMLFSLPKKGG